MTVVVSSRVNLKLGTTWYRAVCDVHGAASDEFESTESGPGAPGRARRQVEERGCRCFADRGVR